MALTGRHSFLISEIAISDNHGGGLTFQRVLGEDLGAFERFVVLGRTSGVWAPTAAAADRTLEAWADFPIDRPGFRNWFGWSVCDRLARLPVVMELRSRVAARRVRGAAGLESSTRILAVPQSDLCLRTMRRLSAGGASLRYAAWVMDDHLLQWHRGAWQYRHDHEALMREHLRGATHVFVISPALGDFYRERFGVDSTVLFGPAAPAGEPVWEAPGGGGPLRLGYFGNIWAWQQDPLQALARRLGDLGATLDVFTRQEELPPEFSLPGVRLCAPIPSDEVPRRMREYDALVLPISFNEELRNLACFNIATKMSECLASGTVTLVIGPPDAAMVRYLEPHGAATLVTGPGLRDAKDAVRTIRDPEPRRAILERARGLVAERLTLEAMRRVWRAGWDRVNAALQA